MILDKQRKEIILAILRTENDWVLKAIKKLLDINTDDISEEHRHILNERIAEYEANPDNVIDWEALKAELLKD